MNTIKIYLGESGRIADLRKDFPLYKGQFNDKLLNVYVPTSILAPQFDIQHYIGQKSGAETPSTEELNEFVAYNTYPTRTPQQGDIIEFYNSDTQEFFIYTYNNNAWESTQVNSFGTLNTLAGTSIKIGMTATTPNGTLYESKSYFMRFLKTLTYDNKEYALYERKLPKEFTSFVGQGQNAPILVINVVNVDVSNNNITSIITSQTCSLDVMVSNMLDQDETIEASDLETLTAQVNELSAKIDLKQDKTDPELATDSKQVVGAINELDGQVATNTENIATNTSDIGDIKLEQISQNEDISQNTHNIETNTDNISDLQQRVSTLEQTAITGETYIGTLSGATLPTDTTLNNFVQSVAERSPQGGDYVYFILEIAGGTDKNYKYTYSNTSGWGGAEIPPMETADNTTLGIIKGSYTGTTSKNFQVNISGGEIVSINIVDTNGTLRELREYLNTTKTTLDNNVSETTSQGLRIGTNEGNISTLQGQMTNILNGTTAVGKATRADQDGNGRNIVSTYLTQSAGATKQQLYDYALPRVFNDVYYLSSTGYQSTIPTGSSPIYTEQTTEVGYKTLFSATQPLTDVQFELTNKNGYETDIFVMANHDCTVTYRLTTEIFNNGDWQTLNIELSEPIVMVMNQIKKLLFASQFNYINGIINVVSGNILRQTLEVQVTVSTPITFNVYSNTTYPSDFILSTSAQVIYIAQGLMGELPIVKGTAEYLVSPANAYIMEIPDDLNFADNVQVLFDISLGAGTPNNDTGLSLAYPNSAFIIPFYSKRNYGTNRGLTLADFKNAQVSNVRYIFTGILKVDNGDLSCIVDLEDGYAIETYSIADTDWTTLADGGIFKYSTTVTADYLLASNTEISLANNNVILMGNYGFSIASVSGQVVTIYAVNAPTEAVNLTIEYKGGELWR